MTIKSRDRKNAEARSSGRMRAARLEGPPIADGPATSNESSITLAGDIVSLIAYVRKMPNNGHRPTSFDYDGSNAV
jgi:hypothetical protein